MEYKDMLPGVASDGIERLVARRIAEHGFLIFRSGWRVSDVVSGEKERCANCVCTSCETHFTLPITEKNARYGGYGVFFPDAGEAKFTCEYGVCPFCGAEDRVFHVSTLGRFGSVMEERTFGEFLRLKDGATAFVTWLVKRRIFKDGREEVGYGKNRAFVFAKEGVHSFSGILGYFYSTCFREEWEELRRVQDSLGAMTVKSIVPVKDELFWGTALENAKIEKYLSEGGDECYPVTYCRAYIKRRCLENLTMSGFSALFNKLCAFEEEKGKSGIVSVPQFVDWKKRRPFEMLRCASRAEAQTLKTLDGETVTVWLMAKKAGLTPTACDLRKWQRLGFEVNRQILKHEQDPTKAIAYMEKQKWKDKGRELDVFYLLDYWNMAKEEGQLGGAEDYYPPNLRRAHDAIVDMRKQRWIEAEAEREKGREGAFTALAKRYEKYRFSYDGLCIRIAAAPIELLEEGKALHHCVGMYIKSHAKGERCIFFIRKAEAPDEPYFTLELDLKTLTHIQNRGLRNCAEPPEVVAFRDKWLKYIREIEAAAKTPAEKKGENAA